MEIPKILFVDIESNECFTKSFSTDNHYKYISVEALKEVINSKITETQRYDTEVGWNSGLRNILNHLNNEDI